MLAMGQAHLASRLLRKGTGIPDLTPYRWAGSGVCSQPLLPQESEALLCGMG